MDTTLRPADPPAAGVPPALVLFNVIVLVLAAVLFVRAASLPARRLGQDPAWEAAAAGFGRNSIWRDGLAEVAHYAAHRTVYGKPRPHEAVLITVAEDLDAATYTKADPPYRTRTLVPVLKLNVVATIPTDNYPYHYMTSVFADLANPTRLVKLAQSSQEWCGTTFKEISGWAAHPVLHTHSYWGGQGDAEHSLPLDGGTLLEDQAPLSLRTLPFAPGLKLSVRLVRSLVDTRGTPPEIEPATVQVDGEEDAPVVGKAWRVVVKAAGGDLNYAFAKASPHLMARSASADGRVLELTRVSRRKYW